MEISDVAKTVGQHVNSIRRMTWGRTHGFPQVVPMMGRKPAVRGVWYIAEEVRAWVQARAVRDAVAVATGKGIKGRPKGPSKPKQNPVDKLLELEANLKGFPIETDKEAGKKPQ